LCQSDPVNDVSADMTAEPPDPVSDCFSGFNVELYLNVDIFVWHLLHFYAHFMSLKTGHGK